MFNKEYLNKVLTDSRYGDGCGMSTRPEYYSGRGATTTDLNSDQLKLIYNAIEKNEGRGQRRRLQRW